MMVARPRHLSKAPIVEAIVDFRVAPGASVGADTFTQLRGALKADYPQMTVKKRRKAKVTLVEGRFKADTVDEGFHGVFFENPETARILQFRSDGFTLNQRKPYPDWATVRDAAFQYWDQYVDLVRPDSVTRIALRYVNRMNIPTTRGPALHEYLQAAPVIPERLPQSIAEFMTRVVLMEPKLNARANVTEALEPSTESNWIRVLLDIDVYMSGTLPLSASELIPRFDGLREFKNAIFFESLTDAAIEVFE